MLAALMLVGMTACKKKVAEPIAPTGSNKVAITLNVDGGAKAVVTPPSVAFETGDKILVASNGHYVGTLTHNGTIFSGDITNPVENMPLYFYFLGNNAVLGSENGNGYITSCTVDISDQTNYPHLPVISMGVSIDRALGNEIVYYQTGKSDYEAQLHNKASLIKFNVTTPSNSPICITGMNNHVTVDFNHLAENDGFSYDKADANGVIKMKGESGSPAVKWAIVLPQDELTTTGYAYSEDHAYIGTRPTMGAITANQFLESGFAMTVNTEYNPLTTPLTFEARAANVTVTMNNSGYNYLQYSLNGGTWTDLTSSGVTLTNAEDKVSFRVREGNQGTSFGSKSFSCTGNCYIYGNVMSLISTDGFASVTTLTTTNVFYRLFANNTKIDIHPSKNLVLPATTLTSSCYGSMFYNCTGLTTAPELPAETLASSCYTQMFYGCTGLTTVPSNYLPATTLMQSCYSSMFSGCTGLTSAPTLSATTMEQYCYSGMFSLCTSLTTAPTLPAEIMANYCYSNMFNGCTSLTTVPSNYLPAETLANYCYQAMFQNCTSLNVAPSLPATTLKPGCYNGMFSRCTNLTEAPALPATTMEQNCYSSMFSGCTGLTTVPSNYLPATTLANSCYMNMFNGCTGLASVPALPATTLESQCYSSMFYGCTSLTTVPSNYLPATTLAQNCYSGMFYGCTGLTTAPALPATTLANYCYQTMFQNCTSLSAAPALPAETLANNCYYSMFQGCTGLTMAPDLTAPTLVSSCYNQMFSGCSSLKSIKCLATSGINTSMSTYNWVQGVASTGTFTKASGITSWPSGNAGIPTNWSVNEQ